MSLSILQRLKAQRQAQATALKRRQEALKQKKEVEEKSKASAEEKSDDKSQSSSSTAPNSSKEDKKKNVIKSWSDVPILFLYGTQTGNAKEISGLLVQEATEAGHTSTSCVSMRDYINSKSFESLSKEQVVVIVVSTTGQGDPPNNSEDMWRLIRRKRDVDWLRGLNYSVLGLGDTNYADFCAMGKFFDSHFSRLGAHRFYPTGLADDATGIDEIVEPWRAGLIPQLKEICSQVLEASGGKLKSASTTGAAQTNEAPKWLQMDKTKPVVILTGEEDGLATPEAKKLQDLLHSTHGFQTVKIWGMKEFCKMHKDLEGLEKAGAVVAIMSTSGPGEVPTNAMRLMRMMKKSKKGSEWLREVRCLVLGMGSTTYENFCGAPKQLSRYFLNLGARVHPLALTCIDKDGDYDKEMQKWREQLSQALMPVKETMRKRPARTSICAPECKAPPLKIDITIESGGGRKDVHKNRGEGLVSRLQSHLVDRERRGLSPDAPFNAIVRRAKLLTKENTKRHVLHLEMALPSGSEGREHGGDMLYLPGDSVGVHCPNEIEEVDRLLKCLKLDGNDVITCIGPRGSPTTRQGKHRGEGDLSHIFLPLSVRDLFLYCIDITSPPKKSLLRTLASYCEEEQERDMLLKLCESSVEGRSAYSKEILQVRPPLSEILKSVPSCRIPLPHLIQVAAPLLPRYYSIASSPSTHPSEVHVAFSLVQFEVKKALESKTQKLQRNGLCTNFLYRECSKRGLVANDYLQKDDQVTVEESPLILPVFIRRGGEFGYPNDISRPIVMIGPGTGVAPFRGFLHYRRYQIEALESGASGVGEWRGMDFQHLDELEDSDEDERVAYPKRSSFKKAVKDMGSMIGPAVLYFGCQKRSRDYLYGIELEDFEADKTLDALHVAFSREKEEKVYVQHLMEQNAEQLYDLIAKKKGFLFVCGDGVRMARDVMAKLTEIIGKQGKMSSVEAKNYVVRMLKEKRYVQDIWS
eukprot:CAMPEP_0184486092 /NCGR_PEP_ID=MMETSP0113_2-20130426/7642_1 /TAXON_ID=91329 /ORGANISM="Norrisiella sphaerica, Strain BC52" /LENGTH=975 /DNA_ID=CAMNT_0026867823 /DNA_START=299 /DNA_END=3226 /DNA_ORIENTATION=+